MATVTHTQAGPQPLGRPGWLPESIWPFEIRVLDLDGTPSAVSEGGRGPTLLFYTGIGSFVWRDVMLRLSADFRCVSLDPPGIGLNAAVPVSATTLATSARAVGAVLGALDLRDVTLVVHDTGGPPAIAAAARTPRRVNRLVAINTFGWRPAGPAFRGMLALMGSAALRRFDVSTGILPRVTSTSFGIGRHLDDASRRAFREGLAQGIDAFHGYLRDARFGDGIFDEVTAALTGVFRELPVLTIFGQRNDPLRFQPQWKQLFPDVEQLVIPKGNHFPMCDDPDLVAGTIRDWHRRTARPPAQS